MAGRRGGRGGERPGTSRCRRMRRRMTGFGGEISSGLASGVDQISLTLTASSSLASLVP